MQTTYKPVLETYIRKVDKVVHLIISGEEIITTVDHPFYVKGRGFIEAGNLLVGDKLVSAIGEDLTIEDYYIELTDKPVSVYNFQVEDFHTYFVGDCAVWVHNAEGCGTPFTSDQQKLIKEAKKANKNGGMTRADANDFVQRSHNAGLNAEIHEGHMQRTNPSLPMDGVSGKPHLHPHNHSLHISIIDD